LAEVEDLKIQKQSLVTPEYPYFLGKLKLDKNLLFLRRELNEKGNPLLQKEAWKTF
jgi:hypothetical protein